MLRRHVSTETFKSDNNETQNKISYVKILTLNLVDDSLKDVVKGLALLCPYNSIGIGSSLIYIEHSCHAKI